MFLTHDWQVMPSMTTEQTLTGSRFMSSSAEMAAASSELKCPNKVSVGSNLGGNYDLH